MQTITLAKAASLINPETVWSGAYLVFDCGLPDDNSTLLPIEKSILEGIHPDEKLAEENANEIDAMSGNSMIVLVQ